MNPWWKGYWLALAGFLLQAGFFSFLEVRDALPSLGLAVVAAYALVHGRHAGLLGLCVGITADLMFGRPLGLGGISYALVALLLVPLGRRLYHEQVLVMVLCLLLAVAVNGVLEMAFLHVMGEASSLFSQRLLVSMGYTVIFAPLLWWLFVKRKAVRLR